MKWFAAGLSLPSLFITRCRYPLTLSLLPFFSSISPCGLLLILQKLQTQVASYWPYTAEYNDLLLAFWRQSTPFSTALLLTELWHMKSFFLMQRMPILCLMKHISSHIYCSVWVCRYLTSVYLARCKSDTLLLHWNSKDIVLYSWHIDYSRPLPLSFSPVYF